jgi:hypothetical protein
VLLPAPQLPLLPLLLVEREPAQAQDARHLGLTGQAEPRNVRLGGRVRRRREGQGHGSLPVLRQ